MAQNRGEGAGGEVGRKQDQCQGKVECQNTGRVNRVRGFPEIQGEQDQNIVLCCLLQARLASSRARPHPPTPFFLVLSERSQLVCSWIWLLGDL